MTIITLLGIAVSLAMDATAVSIATGIYLQKVSARQIFRIAWHFGLFQALMPVIGWLAGRSVAETIAAWDHWAAFGLLAIIGAKMIRDGLRGEDPDLRGDPTRGLSLMTLSIATSIDALAVGFSFALLGVTVWLPAVLIGIVTGLLSLGGIWFGARIGHRWRRLAACLGGAVLVLIGLQILLSHLLVE